MYHKWEIQDESSPKPKVVENYGGDPVVCGYRLRMMMIVNVAKSH